MAAARPTAAKKTAPRKRTTPKAAAAPAAAPAPTLEKSDQEWLDRHTALALDPESALQAEVAMEDIPDGAVAVPIGDGGDIVHIRRRGEWRSSTVQALRTGDFEGWASAALAPGEYENVWQKLDPFIDDITAMFETWGALTGQNAGKAPAPPTSSRNTARR
jgi:pyruvate/2-oxoglutarate dehydrogenase complex dihydrolipoamide acyltransferase (E2) component